MRSPSTAAAERQALVAALREKGPAAATLCEGWTTHDLAVHVVARDSRPHLVLGRGLPVVGSKAQEQYRSFEGLSFAELVDRIGDGVPSWHPARSRSVDDAMNTLEFFVHTEDVLRGDDHSTGADAGPEGSSALQPHRRRLSPSLQRRLWKQASRTLLMAAARKRRRRITYISPGYGSVTHGAFRDPMISLEGAPSELVLWAFGR
ncbi:TIGR03085 family metal-binding protein [Nesterenkonia aerolata]|uniref:TIGR03085 family metal-binding protein n=1 Tax=Nesterenkonia aerolata TaxID=3074079 RepID=A0ABU2DQZ6_9MICC|nr:TIGR03085 family metal-binding protein [Nesterenkonia sp. LY-0111]MDR8018927.1 TIGR03085 family metal-binding protein [Nesterenkonia sp. LY-0111]